MKDHTEQIKPVTTFKLLADLLFFKIHHIILLFTLSQTQPTSTPVPALGLMPVIAD